LPGSPQLTETFISFCRWTARFSPLLRNPNAFKKNIEDNVSGEFRDALTICGLGVEPWEVILASYVAGVLSAVIVLVLAIALTVIAGGGMTALVLIPLACGIAALVAQHYVSSYPKARSRYLRIHSMGDIPEIVSYLVMSMKIIPNLETAFRFAAESSDRAFARDIRRLLFDLSLRVHSSIDEAVSAFAQLWGQWNDYLKRSVYLVRSSLSERDETARMMTLNRALDVVLAGTKAMMEDFAVRLHAPTMVLYSFFIMVPLALVAMLPAASMVGMEVDTIHLFIIYDVILPVVTLLYARSVLSKRPAAFTPPKVPPGHPAMDVQRRRTAVMLAVCAGAVMSVPALPIGPWADAGPWLGPVPRTIFLMWGISVGVMLYAFIIVRPFSKARTRIVAIEEEFADSLFLIGRRITEGRSPEEALAYLGETMPESEIAGVFTRARQNVMVLRFNLYDAFFDSDEGAMRYIGSAKVATVLRLFLQSVERSHTLTGVAITKLADHLKELSDVEASIRRSLATMTGMVRSTAALFAPLIGGVTLAISQALSGLAAATMNQVNPGLTAAGGYIFANRYEVSQVPPEAFVLIIGLYVILLAAILIYFSSGIEFGDDRIAFIADLGIALPSSVAVFSAAAILSGAVFGVLN
jgi:hypothetical protein